jgi:hypothetical protein
VHEFIDGEFVDDRSHSRQCWNNSNAEAVKKIRQVIDKCRDTLDIWSSHTSNPLRSVLSIRKMSTVYSQVFFGFPEWVEVGRMNMMKTSFVTELNNISLWYRPFVNCWKLKFGKIYKLTFLSNGIVVALVVSIILILPG